MFRNMEDIAASVYNDDSISSGYKKEEGLQLKERVFTLHKWHTL